jgi:hypothetical protein
MSLLTLKAQNLALANATNLHKARSIAVLIKAYKPLNITIHGGGGGGSIMFVTHREI